MIVLRTMAHFDFASIAREGEDAVDDDSPSGRLTTLAQN
jgi:hypothetical protein